MATQAERTARLQATIDAQAKRLAELKAKKAKIEARGRSIEKAEARKLETRRLVLLGAFLKSRMDASEESKMKTLAGLDAFLKRPEERALFGFPASQG
jgi:septal ring factor EnvC (AmiA/AmiB activator)